MTTRKYIPKPRDLRFLQAVDYVLEQNKNLFGVLRKESLISSTVFGKRNIISKIRSHQRGGTQAQIEQFALHFNMDFNFFYRDDVQLSLGYSHSLKIADQKEQRPLVKLSGDHSGNIYNSKIYVCLERAQQIIRAKPVIDHNDGEIIINTIRKEIQELEEGLTEQLSKMELLKKEYNLAVIELQNQILEAKKKETQVMEKYIALCEKIQLIGLQTVANGQPKRIQD